MISSVGGIDQDVINIHHHELMKHVLKNFVYGILEYGGCVGQTVGHDSILIMAGRCDEGCLPLITSADSDQVIGALQVKLGKNVSSPKLIDC